MLKIISLGNTLRGDDGIGPAVITAIKEMHVAKEFELIDAGSDAFILLDHLTQRTPIILIDCAVMGKNPGEIGIFPVEKTNLQAVSKAIAIHGFSFSEIYKMASALGETAPCTIIGVEPKSISFNDSLSEEVRRSIPLIINYIIGEAKNHAA